MLYQSIQYRKYSLMVLAITVMLLFSCAPPGRAERDASGLVGHYVFSGNAMDASSVDNHGTANGVVSTTDRDGIANSAYQFDGQDDYILIPNSTSLDISNFQNGYTLAAWIFPDDISLYYRDIVSKGNNGFSIRLNKNILEACHHNVNSTGCQTSNIRISQGEWSHIAVTWDQSTGKWEMYHNGNPANYTGNMQTLITNNDGNVAIGKDPWYDRWYFDGKIDDVRIYNRELQASEIRQLAAPVCVPKTCADISPACGSGLDDGCGGMIDCSCNTTGPQLQWQTVTGANGYHVELDADSQMHRIHRTNPGNVTVSDFGVTYSPSSIYQFRVRAIDSGGLPGAWSPWRNLANGTGQHTPVCASDVPGATQFKVNLEYTNLGKLQYIDHPTNCTPRQEYTYAVGAGPLSVRYNGTQIASNARYSKGGSVASFTYNSVSGSPTFSGGTLTRTFDALGRQDVTTARVGNATQDYRLDIDYDTVGRVDTVRRNFSFGQSTFQYTYGDYGELKTKQLSGAGGSGNVTFQYDTHGNLTSHNSVSTSQFSIPALTNRTFNAYNHNTSFSYDGFGRLLNNTQYQYTYNSLNQIASIRNTAHETLAVFSYDGNGERVRADYEDLTRYTIRDVHQRVLSHVDYRPNQEGCWERNRETDYIYFDNGVILAAKNNNGQTSRAYFIRDYLGSPNVVLNQGTGFTPIDVAYSPYGHQMVSTPSGTAAPFEFTGYERDIAKSDYAHARYYALGEGRFTIPDPARDFNQTNPFSFNLYQYARGNPVSFIDSDGLNTIWLGGAGYENETESYSREIVNLLRHDGVRFPIYMPISNQGQLGNISTTLTLKLLGVYGGTPLPVLKAIASSNKEGGQRNFIGYSYGALVATAAALNIANRGEKVDHLILLASPLASNNEFYQAASNHPNIGRVSRIDIANDPFSEGINLQHIFNMNNHFFFIDNVYGQQDWLSKQIFLILSGKANGPLQVNTDNWKGIDNSISD